MQRLIIALGVLGLLGVAGTAKGDYFTIDSAESYLNVGIWLGGPPAAGGTLVSEAQTGTSDTTSLSGTIGIVISGGSISVDGGTINAAYQPTNLLPDLNGGNAAGPDPGGTGGAPAQVGLQLIPSLGIGVGDASIYDASGTVGFFGSEFTPLVNGGTSFDSTSQIFSIYADISYWLNTTFGFFSGGPLFQSAAAQNGVDSQGNTGYIPDGTVATNDGVTTVTLPVFLDGVTVLDGIPADVIYTGQIVAVSVPEPSTLVLAGVAIVSSAMLMLSRGRLKRRTA